jgi:hypothetical protein
MHPKNPAERTEITQFPAESPVRPDSESRYSRIFPQPHHRSAPAITVRKVAPFSPASS